MWPALMQILEILERPQITQDTYEGGVGHLYPHYLS